jgi:phosphoglucomutase
MPTERVEAPATLEQKERLLKLSPQLVQLIELAGEKIQTVLTHTPGNGAPIGGVKVIAESFRGTDHLRRLLEAAQTMVSDALAAESEQPGIAPEPNRQEKP